MLKKVSLVAAFGLLATLVAFFLEASVAAALMLVADGAFAAWVWQKIDGA